MDLAFATTEELITELIRRETFVVAVVHSKTEHRGPKTVHSNFQISTNMDDESLSAVLNETVYRLRNGNYNKIIKEE